MESEEKYRQWLVARLCLYAAALVAGLWIGSAAPVYWDGFGYVEQAATGTVGGLGLGRPLFVLVSHGLALLATRLGASVWSIEPILRLAWLHLSALSAPLTMSLAHSCGLNRRTSLLAGTAVAFSPLLAHTACGVMTDGPGLTLGLACLISAAKMGTAQRVVRQALWAGMWLGAACAVREQAAWLWVSVLWMAVARRNTLRATGAALLGFTSVVAPLVLFFAIHQEGYFARFSIWVIGVRDELGASSVGPDTIAAYVGWVLALGPATVVAAVGAWTRPTWLSNAALRAICVPSLVQLLAFVGYGDIVSRPRMLVAALPGGLALGAGWWLDRVSSHLTLTKAWTVLGVVFVVPALLAGWVVRRVEGSFVRIIEELPGQLKTVPPNTIIVAAQTCPAIRMVTTLTRSDEMPVGPFDLVCAGWGWPTDLGPVLDSKRRTGRPLVLDLRPDGWRSTPQRRALEQARAYAQLHTGEAGLWVW